MTSKNFEEAEADYMTHNLRFRFLFWKFENKCIASTNIDYLKVTVKRWQKACINVLLRKDCAARSLSKAVVSFEQLGPDNCTKVGRSSMTINDGSHLNRFN